MIKLHPVALTHEILKLIGEIDEFKGEWSARSERNLERLSLLERTAVIESVGCAVRRVGSSLTNQQIENLVSGLEYRDLESSADEQARGYAEALKLVHTSWRAMNLCVDHIRQLHRVLLKHSARDRYHSGEIKRSQEQVEELVRETRLALREGIIHPLLVVAAFEAGFLDILPFLDGNGRLARILTRLLLLRSGYAFITYSSREKIIEKLEETLSPNKWLLFFLNTLKILKDRLKAELAEVRVMTSLPEISENLLRITRDQGRLNMGEAVRLLGKSRNTLKPHFRRLVEEGRLKRHGKGKGTVYSFS